MTGKKKTKKNKAVIIFISVFVGIVIALGATVGIISAVKHANAVVSYNGTSMDREVASFFVSLYKVDYLREVRGEGENPNREGFWESEYKDGKTYGEDFSERAKNYLKEILVACYIFDSHRTLTDDEEEKIEKVCSEVLHKMGNDEDKFNSEAEKHGFDYDSFCDAVKLYYKSMYAFDALYGEGGEGIVSNATVCGSYLNEYTHVSMIVVRTQTKLVNGDNDYLDSAEATEREALIAKMHAAMDAYATDSAGKMTTDAFENWLAGNNESGTEWRETGFYFHPNAEMTEEFKTALPGVVEKAYEMDMYTFAEVETTVDIEIDDDTLEDGILKEKVHVFLYKYPVTDKAYNNSELREVWLSDFFIDAAAYLYTSTLNEYIEDVADGGFADEFDYVSIEHNIDFIPRFAGADGAA